MVDQITAGVVRHLLREDPELLLHLRDLFRRAGEADDRLGKEREEGPDFFGRIALRVDADKDDPERLFALPELPAQLDQPGQRRRTDVGTMGEAEEDRIRLAQQFCA